MCTMCKKVKTIDRFSSPKEYIACLEYIQFLVDSGDFEFESKDCDTDKAKKENGCWVDDFIRHVIKCKNCGQLFDCGVITYQGRGGFEKVK